MKYTPYAAFEKAEVLQQEANHLVNQLELLARHGVERADNLIMRAGDRYSRRTKASHELHDIVWRLGCALMRPHTFVLADMVGTRQAVPDHVLEQDFDYVTCPECDGNKWMLALSPDRHGVDVYARCRRCQGEGEVLGQALEWVA